MKPEFEYGHGTINAEPPHITDVFIPGATVPDPPCIHQTRNALYGKYFAAREEYIRKYRFTNAFHPFHGFSMMSRRHLAEEHTSAIYIAVARHGAPAHSCGG